MPPYDFTTPGTPPESFWQRNGGFVVILTILFGMMAWTHLGHAPAGPSARALPQSAGLGADLKSILMSIVSIVAQLYGLYLLVRILWPIIKFFGYIVIGLGIGALLLYHGLV